MLIQSAVKLIGSIPDGWVRMEQFRRISGGFEVSFSIHKGQRGKKIEGWSVRCRGVHEAKISEMDGGGLGLYASNHPAAWQYVARRAELRWGRTCDEAKVLLALFRAHVEAVDDWIPFDRYLQVGTNWNSASFLPNFAPVSGKRFVCRGPDFLLRAYARALEAVGEEATLTMRSSAKPRSIRPRVLHFGDSYIVADVFTAERQEEVLRSRRG
jgi:hypothetical protein